MITLHACYRFPRVVQPPGLLVARSVVAGSLPVTKKPEVSCVVSYSAEPWSKDGAGLRIRAQQSLNIPIQLKSEHQTVMRQMFGGPQPCLDKRFTTLG